MLHFARQNAMTQCVRLLHKMKLNADRMGKDL